MDRLKLQGNKYRECLEKMNKTLREEQKTQMDEINKVILTFQRQLFEQFHQKQNENYNLVRCGFGRSNNKGNAGLAQGQE